MEGACWSRQRGDLGGGCRGTEVDTAARWLQEASSAARPCCPRRGGGEEAARPCRPQRGFVMLLCA